MVSPVAAAEVARTSSAWPMARFVGSSADELVATATLIPLPLPTILRGDWWPGIEAFQIICY